jgi:hypothetical protein
MKKHTTVTWAVIGGALLIMACQSRQDSLTTPTTSAGQEGTAGAKVFATPSSSPIGPTPGGPGPKPSPLGPYPGFPATPTPAPTPTPPPATPTPAPTPTPCPVGDHEYTLSAPFPTSGGGSGPKLTVDDLPNCNVSAVETSIQVDAADLAASTATGKMKIGLFLEGKSISTLLVSDASLTGTQMGTSCTDLLFKVGGADFSTATSPYTGTFAPFGDTFTADGTFAGLVGQAANGTWSLPLYGIDAPVRVVCWKLKLTTVAAPPPSPTPTPTP